MPIVQKQSDLGLNSLVLWCDRILLEQQKKHHLSRTTYLRDADDVHSKQQCGQQTHSDFKEKLSETMIKQCNDYKC